MSKSQIILPPAMLGMLGGGQLGRFFVIAAHEMGYKVTVLDPDKNSPAGKIADVHLCAAYDDAKALAQMAESCEAVTTEFENIPATSLEFFEKIRTVRPSAKAVSVAQHRVMEKTFIRDSGLPVAPFVVINATQDVPADNEEIYPAILKIARFGYDGKGQARVKNQAEALAAFDSFKQEQCVLEKMVKLDAEISVVLARDADGTVVAFPAAENSHLNGILDTTIVPARVPQEVQAKAYQLAAYIAQKLDYIGVLAVEFFVSGGQLLVNEMAPRPHNSGHYTIDACVASQFEQQVRALVGLPLGETRMHSYAVMVNVLGDVWFDKKGKAVNPSWDFVLANPRLKMHFYGKHEARAGRKMAHFTVLDRDVDSALVLANAARDVLGIGK